jgi:hypothetical protein
MNEAGEPTAPASVFFALALNVEVASELRFEVTGSSSLYAAVAHELVRETR